MLGGTFLDLPVALRVKLPRNSLQFDPASGLFGLVPTRTDGALANVEARSILSQAIDRDALVAAFRVPGLAGRATLLEPGLDGLLPPAQPSWTATPLAQRRAALAAAAGRIFDNPKNKTVTLFLPAGPGSDILFNRVAMDWSALGLTVERVPYLALADFKLIDSGATFHFCAAAEMSIARAAAPACRYWSNELAIAVDPPVPCTGPHNRLL